MFLGDALIDVPEKKQFLRIQESNRYFVKYKDLTLLLFYGLVIARNKDDYGECIILPHELQTSLIGQETWRIGSDDPMSARADLSWQMFIGRRIWHVTSDIHSAMWSDENWFYMTANIQAGNCADVVFNKSWNTRTPRVFL